MNELILFPAYMGRPLDRLLSLWDEGAILAENGQTWSLYSLSELASLLLAERLLLFISSLSLLPLPTLHYLVQRATVWCNEQGDPLSAQFVYPGGATRWICSSSSWGYKVPTLEMLTRLRAYFQTLGVGATTSPGGAGLSKLRHSWQDQFQLNWKAHRHERPNEEVCRDLIDRGMGARSDVLTKQTFEFAWELDRKNAYGADLSAPLPTGPCVRFGFGLEAKFPLWVGTCTVTISEQLCYGLFPMRDPISKQLYYPTKPGNYKTWLWSCQADLCRRHGLIVQPDTGWGWYETTTDCAFFVQQMEQLRDDNPAIADLIKLTLVAAIGRLGMDNIRYFLSEHGDDDTDIRVCMEKRAYNYFRLTEIDYRPTTMPHWYWSVMARASTNLTEEAYSWAKGEMLIATNTDAVILKPEADISKYPSKSSALSQQATNGIIPSGAWRGRKLQEVTVPALRHLIAKDAQTGEIIDKRPGIAKEGRK